MRIVSFFLEGADAPRPGALIGTQTDGGPEIVDFTAEATGIPAPARYLDWFDTGGGALREARGLCEALQGDEARVAELRERGGVVPRANVRLAAPVPRPGKVICIGLNYRDHAEESGMDIPERPLFFSKFPTSIAAPGQPVVIPPDTEQVDYESELAIVIGRRASRVKVEDGYDHVLGYTNLNDVSARDFQFTDGQWQRGKSCDTFAPLGEYVATTDEIPDPHKLFIRFHLNGKTLQDSNTDQLIFGVPELVSFLSQTVTLEPGDVIATGTPPGVGFARKPPIWVQPGDRMQVEIEGLGVLENPVVGPNDAPSPA